MMVMIGDPERGPVDPRAARMLIEYLFDGGLDEEVAEDENS